MGAGVWPPRTPLTFKDMTDGQFCNTVYTCQKLQRERCNFFLWDDDAKIRETAAVLSNSRSEPVSDSGALSNEYSIPLSPPPPYSPFEIPSNVGDVSGPNVTGPNGDSSGVQTIEGELPLDWLLSNEGEQRRLEAIGNSTGSTTGSRKRTIQQPETPRKAPKADALDSPRQQWRSPPSSPHISGLPTPNTERTSRSVVTMSSARGLRTASPVERGTSQFLTPSVTPTSSRFRSICTGLGEDSSLSEEILEVLDKSCKLQNDTREKIKTICNKHSVRTQGIAKGLVILIYL